MRINYRHYQKGDDAQLTDLFNRAFQMNGGGQIKTSIQENWRYARSPGFEPEMVQIAEDAYEKKIVGAIFVNLVEYVPFNGTEYLTGEINDVSTHPDYTGKGIAKNLMDMAIEYMKKRNCDISMLTADYHGFPRKKIYLKYGYKDYDREIAFLKFGHIPRFIKDFKAGLSIFPIMIVLTYGSLLLNRIRLKFNPKVKELAYEICSNRKQFEYTKAANKIFSKYFTGYPGYDHEKTLWARVNIPLKRLRPTFILIWKNNKIIGGAQLSTQNIYAFKFGFKMRIGFIHEIFLDKSQFQNERDLYFGYLYLIDKLQKAAIKKRMSVVFYLSSSQDRDLHKAFKGFNFLSFKGGTVMIKKMKDNIHIPPLKKALYIPTYVSFGAP